MDIEVEWKSVVTVNALRRQLHQFAIQPLRRVKSPMKYTCLPVWRLMIEDINTKVKAYMGVWSHVL